MNGKEETTLKIKEWAIGWKSVENISFKSVPKELQGQYSMIEQT